MALNDLLGQFQSPGIPDEQTAMRKPRRLAGRGRSGRGQLGTPGGRAGGTRFSAGGAPGPSGTAQSRALPSQAAPQAQMNQSLRSGNPGTGQGNVSQEMPLGHNFPAGRNAGYGSDPRFQR